jgi:CheY-like chemotaxis protein
VLGHKVEVVSAAGKGSCFSIEAPRGEAMPAGLPATEAALIDPGQLAGITTLCIDNEPAILDGMETLLRGWGCTVIKAPDLELAVEAMARGPMPNGLLVDYHLDSGNGLEAIAALRQRLHGELPAILITADRSPRVRAEARAANIQVLHKPIKPAALRAMLAQWRVLRIAAAE